VGAIIEAAGDRIKTAGDILDYDCFFVADDALLYDDAAFEKRLTNSDRGQELLLGFRGGLVAVESFEAGQLEQRLHAFVEAQGVKAADLVHPLRIALTGNPVGFGLFGTLAILGRERCLARIDRALATAASRDGKTP
jgi:glutamyl-tRNA synthetase